MRTHWSTCVLAAVCLLCAVALATAAETQGPPSVEVHGWMLTRYYVNTTVDATKDSQGRITSEEDDSWVETERLSLSGIARLPNDRQAYAEVYIHPWLPNSDPSFLYLESCYLDVPAGEDAKLRIGKGRNMAFGIVPGYGSRKTSNYGPLAEEFTMDRVVGIQYLQQRGDDSLAVALLNAQRPGARLIGMAADAQLDRGSAATATVPHLTDRDVPNNRSDELEVSARYGRQMGALNVGFSGRKGALDSTDAAYLAGAFAGSYTGSGSRTRYGVDATLKAAPIYGTVEYYAGETGGVKHDGYAVLLGVEPTAECTGMWRELSSMCKGIYLRYTKLDIDVPPTASPMTWDTQQFAVSYVLPLKGVLGKYPKWLQFEYERNKESVPAPADETPNNLFFVELFTAF